LIQKLFHKKALWIVVTVVVIVALLWQTAIIEIMLSTRFDGPHDENVIALSFDDGPDWGEEELITALNDAEIHATFFWIWEKIEQIEQEDKERFKRLLDLVNEGGHEIGIHGYACDGSQNPVKRFLLLDQEEDLSHLVQNYRDLFGLEPVLYRSHGPRAGRQFYDSLKHAGLDLTLGSLTHQISLEASTDIFVDYVRDAEPGTIICAHDSRNCDSNYGLADRIAKIVPELERIIRDRNIEIVTISELTE